MYLKCKVLRATLPLKNCEQFRGSKNGSVCCVCKDWKEITENPLNRIPAKVILEQAQLQADSQSESESKPPIKFSNPKARYGKRKV